jgi:NAD(P)-dependent dehydrogenase (short-subunit alcohol dehydrogenase family)
MHDLRGRMAFITGGGSGIGLGIARAAAQAGMTLALADIDGEALDRATAEFSPATKVAGLPVDVADRAALAAAADKAEAELGPVALLCNNASMNIELPLAEMTYEAWDYSLGVTLGGVINGVQTFLPRMLRRARPAHIVNTASQVGLMATHGGRNYAKTTTKFAVVGFSESLREALRGTGVGITLLLPGYVATDTAKNTLKTVARLQLPAKVRAGVVRQLEELDQRLAELGRDPDQLGREVLQAVRDDRFYLHTTRRAQGVADRARELIEAMPAETGHDRALAGFLDH